VNLLSAVHQLAWTQHPTIWLCESCAILWLVVRTVRSPWVRAGVLLMLCGLVLNALVTDANAGTMPVVDMPSTLHPASPMWRAATPKTRLPFLADQARLGLFSVGDLMMIFGGIVIVTICLHRTLKAESSPNYKRLAWILRKTRTSQLPPKHLIRSYTKGATTSFRTHETALLRVDAREGTFQNQVFTVSVGATHLSEEWNLC
jgi:hypothetical protein